jgi:hypothetical protein
MLRTMLGASSLPLWGSKTVLLEAYTLWFMRCFLLLTWCKDVTQNSCDRIFPLLWISPHIILLILIILLNLLLEVWGSTMSSIRIRILLIRGPIPHTFLTVAVPPVLPAHVPEETTGCLPHLNVPCVCFLLVLHFLLNTNLLLLLVVMVVMVVVAEEL